MHKRVTFDAKLLPFLLVAPQILITIVFFFWPASQAIIQSVLQEDAFGLSSKFIWFENFERVFDDPHYLASFKVTAIFAISVTALSLGVGLLFAVMADRVIKGAGVYRTFLVWPYAVAPAVAGVLWGFLFNPTVGVIAAWLKASGYNWNYLVNGDQALFLLTVAAAWNRIPYCFLFFLAGLQSIPKSLIEAAAIDGAGPARRFWTIVFPLLSPTGFFLMVVTTVYTFFETFGTVHAVTGGGPAKATEILVFKVYNDSFRALDLGGSAAQSVILMAIVIALTVVQFRYIERKVHY
ncbi:MAG: sn-glycerol-3-phosphate ABC transporter permease UgpA [Alphaproteobacteria bacterium]|nr:sn-glycerol-3-phosphate ABC transporter permease UgpA [Alphaproteobacteria bacterium]